MIFGFASFAQRYLKSFCATRLRASIHLGEQVTSGNVQVGRHQQQLVQQLVQAGGVETIGALEFARCRARPPCTCVDKLVRETQCVSLGFVTHQTQICHHMLGFVRQQTQICHRIHQLLVRLLNDSTIARKSLFQEKKIKMFIGSSICFGLGQIFPSWKRIFSQ